MKVWVDGYGYGGHLMCQEYPEYNFLDVFYEGIEKDVNHPVFGGKSMVSF